MADGAMAMHAGQLSGRNLIMHERAMAVHAVVLEDAAVLGRHHDRLVEILERERLRMVKAVLGLGEILADEAVRQVAIHAHGDPVVARLLPGVVLRLHDVAVHAYPRVVAHVREAFRIQEREAADTEQQSHQNGQDERSPRRSDGRAHPRSLLAPTRLRYWTLVQY